VVRGARAWSDQLWGQEIKGQGHTRPKIDLEATEAHSQPLSVDSFSSLSVYLSVCLIRNCKERKDTTERSSMMYCTHRTYACDICKSGQAILRSRIKGAYKDHVPTQLRHKTNHNWRTDVQAISNPGGNVAALQSASRHLTVCDQSSMHSQQVSSSIDHLPPA